MSASRGDLITCSEETLGGVCLCVVRKISVCANSDEVIRFDIVGTNRKKISSSEVRTDRYDG